MGTASVVCQWVQSVSCVNGYSQCHVWMGTASVVLVGTAGVLLVGTARVMCQWVHPVSCVSRYSQCHVSVSTASFKIFCFTLYLSLFRLQYL